MSVRSKPNREVEAPAEPERNGGELPEGWVQATLGDVVESMKNGVYKPASSYSPDGTACLRMYNIEAGAIVWKDIKRMTLTAIDVEDYGLLPGDILVNRVNSRELVGKSAVIPDDIERCVFESKNIRVRLRRDAVCPKFANYRLLQRCHQHFTQNAQQVVGMASISQPQVAAFPLPLPPLAEQRRIVGKLELLLGKVSSIQQRLSRVPGLLKRFRQSVLAAACSGKLTADWREQNDATISDELSALIGDVSDESFSDDLPTSWRCVRLEALCELITKGASPKWQGVDYVESGVLFVTSENVGIGRTLLDSKKYVQPKFNDIQPRSILQRGDVLTTLVGASIGRTAIFDSDELANINQAVGLIRLKPLISNTFIMNVLNSPKLLDHMHDQKVDVARANVSLKDVRVFPIPVPPLSEQQEIVCRVEKLFAFADQIEARLRLAAQHVDRLTQSLLAKAFRGELVPTEHTLATAAGREYESASELLARIRATNGNASPAKPKRGKASQT